MTKTWEYGFVSEAPNGGTDGEATPQNPKVVEQGWWCRSDMDHGPLSGRREGIQTQTDKAALRGKRESVHVNESLKFPHISIYPFFLQEVAPHFFFVYASWLGS